MLTYLFEWTWRELYKTIRPLMYQGLAKEIIKENYVSNYYLEEKKIQKKEVKKITFISDNEDKLKEILSKNLKFKEF